MFKEIIEDKNVLHGFLTKYRGSLGANGDFRQQIFARDCMLGTTLGNGGSNILSNGAYREYISKKKFKLPHLQELAKIISACN